MAKSEGHSGLVKIVVVILVLGAAALGIARFADWLNDSIGGTVEASAPSTMQQARELADNGEYVKARELLRPIIARVKNDRIVLEAVMLQADIEENDGNVPGALEALRTATEDFPNAPEQPAAAIRYARLLEASGDVASASSLFTMVSETAAPEFRVPALSGLAREKVRAGEIDAAQALYREATRLGTWGSADWREAAAGLGSINSQLIFSHAPSPGSKVYRVQKGDSLTTIGMKLNTTQGLLMRANGLDNPNRLRLRQNLKYSPKDFQVVLERSTCTLYLLDDEGIFKVYSVGLGKPGQDTTLGNYKIGNKEKNPTWHKPGAGPIPPGDPRNELGTRWMPLVPEEEGLPTDLGIHGTIAPDSIGKYSSMGCPRLHNEEAEELYDLIVRSTPVTIVEHYSPS